jgi:hypothetical protein
MPVKTKAEHDPIRASGLIGSDLALVAAAQIGFRLRASQALERLVGHRRIPEQPAAWPHARLLHAEHRLGGLIFLIAHTVGDHVDTAGSFVEELVLEPVGRHAADHVIGTCRCWIGETRLLGVLRMSGTGSAGQKQSQSLYFS